jgi:hypothetical protein
MEYKSKDKRLSQWHLLEYTRRLRVEENWRSFIDAAGNQKLGH